MVICLPDSSRAEDVAVSEKGKNWKIKLDANFVYEDNVVASPDNSSIKPAGLGQEGDEAFEWNGAASYDFKINKKFKWDLDYDINQIVYDDLDQYNLVSQIFGTGGTYKINPLTHLQLNYKFIYNILDGDNYSGSQYLSPSFNYMNKKFGLTRLDFTFKYTDNYEADTRDKNQYAFGITQYMLFSNYTRRVSLSYKYTIDDADGPAFDRDFHTIALKGQTPLPWGMKLYGKGKWIISDYDSFLTQASDLREDTKQQYYVKLSKLLLDQWKCMRDLTLAVKYKYTFNDSNLLVREYESNLVSVGLAARF